MKEADFIEFIKFEWPRLEVMGAIRVMAILVEKLKLLKRLVCDWKR